MGSWNRARMLPGARSAAATYPIALGIVDFVGSTRGRPSATAYNRAFVVETLYRTAADLETRVRLFNTRLRHNAGAGVRA